MASYYKLVVIAVILLVASVPTYGRSIFTQDLIEAEIEAMSLKEDPKIEVKQADKYEELVELKSDDALQGGLQCTTKGALVGCFINYCPDCCSKSCSSTSYGVGVCTCN